MLWHTNSGLQATTGAKERYTNIGYKYFRSQLQADQAESVPRGASFAFHPRLTFVSIQLPSAFSLRVPLQYFRIQTPCHLLDCPHIHVVLQVGFYCNSTSMTLHPPLEVVRTWPTPNYVDPITHGYSRMVVTIIFIPLILLILVLRYYTRLSLTNKKFDVDDILIAITTVSLSCSAPLQLASTYQSWQVATYIGIQSRGHNIRWEVLCDPPHLGHPADIGCQGVEIFPGCATHLQRSDGFGQNVASMAVPPAFGQQFSDCSEACRVCVRASDSRALLQLLLDTAFPMQVSLPSP